MKGALRALCVFGLLTVMRTAGVSVTMWQYWAVIVLLIIYTVLCAIEN